MPRYDRIGIVRAHDLDFETENIAVIGRGPRNICARKNRIGRKEFWGAHRKMSLGLLDKAQPGKTATEVDFFFPLFSFRFVALLDPNEFGADAGKW